MRINVLLITTELVLSRTIHNVVDIRSTDFANGKRDRNRIFLTRNQVEPFVLWTESLLFKLTSCPWHIVLQGCNNQPRCKWHQLYITVFLYKVHAQSLQIAIFSHERGDKSSQTSFVGSNKPIFIRYYVQSKIHSSITRLRVHLHQASASTLPQLCDGTSDTVLIKNNEVSQKWVVTLILGDSVVFDENRILSISTELSLQHWHWRLV